MVGVREIELIPLGMVTCPWNAPFSSEVNGKIVPDKFTDTPKSCESGLRSGDPSNLTAPSMKRLLPGSTGNGYIDENWSDTRFPR